MGLIPPIILSEILLDIIYANYPPLEIQLASNSMTYFFINHKLSEFAWMNLERLLYCFVSFYFGTVAILQTRQQSFHSVNQIELIEFFVILH